MRNIPFTTSPRSLQTILCILKKSPFFIFRDRQKGRLLPISSSVSDANCFRWRAKVSLVSMLRVLSCRSVPTLPVFYGWVSCALLLIFLCCTIWYPTPTRNSMKRKSKVTPIAGSVGPFANGLPTGIRVKVSFTVGTKERKKLNDSQKVSKYRARIFPFLFVCRK